MDSASVSTRVLENLSDLGVSFYTVSDSNEAITDIYNRLAVLTGCITKVVAIPSLSEPHWNLRTLVPDYLFPLGIYNYATNCWLTPITRRYADSIRWDWELWVGQPAYFSVVDYHRISVLPHLATSSGVLLLVYRATPPTLSDTSTFQIPSSFEEILEFGATAELLEQSKEYKKASIYIAKFQEYLVEVRRRIKLLAETDKLRVMAPYNELPLFGSGTSGGSSSTMFIDNEIPTGTINGVNPTFTLVAIPSPAISLVLILNGIVLFQGVAYTLSGSAITFNSSYIPQTGDLLRAWYRVS